MGISQQNDQHNMQSHDRCTRSEPVRQCSSVGAARASANTPGGKAHEHSKLTRLGSDASKSAGWETRNACVLDRLRSASDLLNLEQTYQIRLRRGLGLYGICHKCPSEPNRSTRSPDRFTRSPYRTTRSLNKVNAVSRRETAGGVG